MAPDSIAFMAKVDAAAVRIRAGAAARPHRASGLKKETAPSGEDAVWAET
jgi:hypothetical protein